MKKFMIPGAAAVATAALSLLLGGGVANAQEAAQAPAPVQVPAIHVVDALDSAIKDAPQAPAIPASDVLTFLSDSINLLGRDILSTKDFSAKSLSTLVKAENTPADPQDPKGNGALDMVLKVVPYVVPLLAIPAWLFRVRGLVLSLALPSQHSLALLPRFSLKLRSCSLLSTSCRFRLVWLLWSLA